MPATLRLDAFQPADIAHAADLLRQGRLVAFPTETVYGLGANAFSAQAVAGIFAAKQRPSWDPLIVHLASAEQLRSVAEVPPELQERIAALAAAFWPGPLTLLLPRTAAIPDAVTAGRPLVGVRVPGHAVARALILAAGIPLAAPSANRFGHTSPTTAEHVLADLEGRIDAVLDAGPTSVGVESTVLDPTQTPMVLYRPGAVTEDQLIAATGIAVRVFVPESIRQTPPSSAALPSFAALPSPGVGLRHYAPRAQLLLVDGTPEVLERALVAAAEDGTERIGVLLPDAWRVAGDVVLFPWGSWHDQAALATNLFAGLRALDDRGVTLILAPLPPPGGMGDALRDRLQKAARPVDGVD